MKLSSFPMGCCCSTEQDDNIPYGEPSERTRLLQDGGMNNHSLNSSGEYDSHCGSSCQDRSEEHSSHSKILNRTAGKLIDVGAPDCQTLEEHEYADRARAYSHRLYKITAPEELTKQYSTPSLLLDVPSAEKILSADPISRADFLMMHNATSKLIGALNQLKIDCDEPVLVPFGDD